MQRTRRPDPTAFRARLLARLRGDVPVAVAPANPLLTEKQRRKQALNTVRNAQRRRALTRWQWRKLKERFGGKCAYCGQAAKRLHREHFVPIHMGGTLRPSNVLPACQSCNNRKGQQHSALWLMEQDKLALYFELTVFLAGQRR